MPFSCKKRLDYSRYENPADFATILKAGLFPLTLRSEDSKPNVGRPNRFFGGTNPPALTVQNLWVDFLKRVLSYKLRDADSNGKKREQDRLGIAGERKDTRDVLLWDLLQDKEIETIPLDDYDHSVGKELQLLELTESSISKFSKTDTPGCWLWHDVNGWAKSRGKLPIVSMNTSIEELQELFEDKNYKQLPGVVISIDQWRIEGDTGPYEYSVIDERYGITSQRFHSDEQEGSRTYATLSSE